MSVRKNLASLLLSQLLTWMVSFVLLVEAPDRLGKSAWGTVSYASAFVGFFILVAGLGTNTLLTREVARDQALLSQYVYNAVLLKAVMIIAIPLIGMGLAYALGNRGETLLIIGLGFGGMAMTVLTEVATGALAGLELIARPAFFMVIQVYVANGLGLLVLVLGHGVVAYAAVFAGATAIPAVLTWIMLIRRLHGPFTVDGQVWRMFVRAGIPLMALTVFNMIYGTVDIPILEFITDKDTVGLYSLAYKWVGVPIFIATAVVSAYFPRFSAHGQPVDAEFPRLVNQAVRVTLLASVPTAIGLAMVSDELMRALYHPDYGASAVLIQILAVHIPLAAMDTVLAVALIASDRHHRYLYVSIIAAIVNPVACVLLIHWAVNRHGNGAIGASIVTVGTELLVMIGAITLRGPGVLDRRTTTNCLRVMLAGLAIVPVLLAGNSLALPVQVALGATAYGLGLFAFRAITFTELRGLAASVTGRGRPAPQTTD